MKSSQRKDNYIIIRVTAKEKATLVYNGLKDRKTLSQHIRKILGLTKNKIHEVNDGTSQDNPADLLPSEVQDEEGKADIGGDELVS